MSDTQSLRILHLIQSRRFAGSERLMLTLADEQRRAGHEVHVAVKPGGPLQSVLASDGWQAIPIALGRPWTALQLRRYLRHHPVDIVHAHLSQAVRLGVRVGKQLGLCTIGHAHVYKPGKAYQTLAENGSLIAISRDIQAYYAKMAGVAEPTLPLIENGVDRRFTPRSVDSQRVRALRQSLDVADEDCLLTLTGRLAEQKGADVLVEACAELARHDLRPQLRLFGAGQGASEWARRLQQRIEGLGLSRAVRLAGFADDVALLMAASDIHVVPSRYEPFGLTAIEGMAMGTAVVASRVGGLAEVISDEVDGCLVPAADPKALADCLAGLMIDPDKRQRLGQAAMATVERRFSGQAMAQRVEALYRQQLASA